MIFNTIVDVEYNKTLYKNVQELNIKSGDYFKYNSTYFLFYDTDWAIDNDLEKTLTRRINNYFDNNKFVVSKMFFVMLMVFIF